MPFNTHSYMNPFIGTVIINLEKHSNTQQRMVTADKKSTTCMQNLVDLSHVIFFQVLLGAGPTELRALSSLSEGPSSVCHGRRRLRAANSYSWLFSSLSIIIHPPYPLVVMLSNFFLEGILALILSV